MFLLGKERADAVAQHLEEWKEIGSAVKKENEGSNGNKYQNDRGEEDIKGTEQWRGQGLPDEAAPTVIVEREEGEEGQQAHGSGDDFPRRGIEAALAHDQYSGR